MKQLFLMILMGCVGALWGKMSFAEETRLFSEEQRILTESQVKEALLAVEKHTLDALAAAKAEDTAGVSRHVKAARDGLKLVVGDHYGAAIQRAASHLRIAAHKAKKNDRDAALDRLAQALAAIQDAKTRTLQPPKDKRW